MINFNGTLLNEKNALLTANNRAFKYGDAIFETIRYLDSKCSFIEDHYFRLMASMRMLRMEIPMYFTVDFLKEEIDKTAIANDLKNARVRLTVFRNDGGTYAPETHQASFLIECVRLEYTVKDTYVIDVFKDYFISTGLLSTVKTTNRLINVLAGIYATENKLDNCILLNDKKFVAEAINGNLFIVVGKNIKTPSLQEGCIHGIIRKKIIEIISDDTEFEIEETAISPFELLKADELFITNAIIGVQPVKKYRKTEFSDKVSKELRFRLKALI